MLNKRKTNWWLAITLACLMVLGACSSGSGGDGRTDQQDSNNPAQDTIELTMQAWGNPAEIEVYNRALIAFTNENPDIKVKLIPVPGGQYEQKVMTQLQGSQGPDVFYSYEPMLAKLIEAGRVQPLSDFFATDASYVKEDEFPDGLWGPARKDGIVYGATPDTNPMVMYYNKKVFEETGIKTPQQYADEGNWSWDTFELVTGQLRDAGKRGYIAENWWGHWYSWIWSNGGDMFDADGNFVLADNAQAQDAIRFIHKLVTNGNMIYAGSLPQGQGSDAMFMSDQVGMISAGRWLEPLFHQNDALSFDYVYWPSNTGKQEPVAIPVAYMAVNKDSKHVDAAMKFLSYYVSVKGQEARLAENGSALGAIPAADALIKPSPKVEHFDVFFEARDHGFTHGSPKAYDAQVPGLNSDIAETFDLMLLGKQDAEQTIAKLIEVVGSYLR